MKRNRITKLTETINQIRRILITGLTRLEVRLKEPFSQPGLRFMGLILLLLVIYVIFGFMPSASGGTGGG